MLSDKSPTLRDPACQGVLGLVFHRSPGTSIRPQYMPVKRAECFPFRDFILTCKTWTLYFDMQNLNLYTKLKLTCRTWTLYSGMQKYNFVEINLVQLCLQTLLVVGFVGYHLQTLVICTTFVVSSPTISKEDYIHNHRYVEITTFRNSHVFLPETTKKNTSHVYIGRQTYPITSNLSCHLTSFGKLPMKKYFNFSVF